VISNSLTLLNKNGADPNGGCSLNFTNYRLNPPIFGYSPADAAVTNGFFVDFSVTGGVKKMRRRQNLDPFPPTGGSGDGDH
jgi:hypothetical protein